MAAESKSGEAKPVTAYLTRTFPPQTAQELLAGLAKDAAAEETVADVYGVGASQAKLEAEVAAMMGKEWGVLMVSGVMAQLIACKVHCAARARKTIALHRTSHLMCHEHDSYRELLGLEACVVGDAVKALSASALTSIADPESVGVAIIELPQRENGGQTMPWADLVAVRKWATKHQVALHLDGARLWEVLPFYEGKTYADVCALFDTVYVSFYKGLGGMVGAMLCGNAPLHNPVFTWLRRFGGNIYTQLPIMVSARSCLRRHTTFPARFAKLRSVVAKIRAALSAKGTAASRIITFVPEVPQSCLVHTYFGCTPVDDVLQAVETVKRSHGIQVVSRVRQSRFAPASVATGSSCADAPPPGVLQPFSYTEWNMGVENLAIDDDTFVTGWTAFADALAAIKAADEETSS